MTPPLKKETINDQAFTEDSFVATMESDLVAEYCPHRAVGSADFETVACLSEWMS